MTGILRDYTLNYPGCFLHGSRIEIESDLCGDIQVYTITLMYTFNMKNNRNLRLSKMQRELLVGLLLGDGHLETQTDGRTYRLRVEHSEKQKEYLFWLYEQFKEWVPQEPKKKTRTDGRISYEMVTVSHSAFRFYAHQYYVDKKKGIPRLVHRWLTPVALAIWFMDDGSIKSSKHKTFNIHALGYSKKDLLRVQDVLERRFEITTALHKQRNNSWRIYIPSESVEEFVTLVYPTMKHVPSMLYKLNNKMPKE